MLRIDSLCASVADKPVLKGVNLNIPAGEVHVIMGPNGIGKSTLGHVLMGNKAYQRTSGEIFLDGKPIHDAPTDERARGGLFLAFQYPVAIPGLKISEYLRNLYCQRHGTQVGVAAFRKILKEKLDILGMDRSCLQRYLNEGFSGGETKRLEILQLMVAEPKIAILDEIDSGLDVDAQKIVAQAIEKVRKESGTSFLLITHYQRLVNILNPHRVHVMLDGQIKRSGDMSLVFQLEKDGYDWVRTHGDQEVIS